VLAEHLDAQAIVPDLKASTKEEAIGALVDHLAGLKRLPDAAAAREAILAREKVMSTGIGHGVAIPHAKIAGLKNFAVALGRSVRGVKYDAVDASPAKIILLFLSPGGKTKEHVQLLADATKRFKFAYLRQGVLEARDAAAIAALFKE
jgi:mannitol/fructose-specific phosphotransferase system IIA component (Ntr-type)